MNGNCFKKVFSRRTGTWVAVGEHVPAASGGKAGAGSQGARQKVRSALYVGGLSLSALACQMALAEALPTGAAVQHGQVRVGQTSPTQMNIVQGSDKAIVNWQSFSIGAGARVDVQQPSATSVLLNRVVGAEPSTILGQLQANGRVVLVNPNGVLFGKDGSVNATSFTASTLGITDDSFLSGDMRFENHGSTAAVRNQGVITSRGGYVALLGATVSNEGRIETQGGAALLGAAQGIRIPLSDSGRIKLELTPAQLNAQVVNSQTGSIVTHGGQVYMQAGALQNAMASIVQSGGIDTTGEQGGAVHLLADAGRIQVNGRITAHSTGQGEPGQRRAGGDIYIGRDKDTNALAAESDARGARLESQGGFVETSGRQLSIEQTQVAARTWLLDPDNIDITNAGTPTTGYSKVSATDVSNALNAGANVVIHTTNGVSTSAGSVPYTASNPGEGNILVSSAISKTSGGNASLTLTADNGLTVNAGISASGASTGSLNIALTANGQTNGKAVGAMTAQERALSRGLMINGAGLNANGGDITLTGTSYASVSGNANAGPTNAIGKGIQIHGGASLTARDITITGVAQNQGGDTSTGLLIQRYPAVSTYTASRHIAITGTLQGAGNGSAIDMRESGWGSQSVTMTAGGALTIRGNNRGSSSNASQAIYVGAGLQARAVGNITVQAETNNAAVNAISFVSSSTTMNGGLNGNVSLRSIDANSVATGDVLIQANRGGITFNNQLPSASSATAIVGRHITIDNTGAGMAIGAGTAVTGSGGTQGASLANGGSIAADTGAISKGTGSAQGTSGINMADARSLSASGNLHIQGVTASASNSPTGFFGVSVSGQLQAANFSLQGEAAPTGWNNSATGLRLVNGTQITGSSSSGANLIKGTYTTPQYGASNALLLGDSGASTVTLNSATLLSLEGDSTGYSALFNSGQIGRGIMAQGTVNTTGSVSWTGSSRSSDGILSNAVINHSGGALSLVGSSSPLGISSGFTANGVALNGTLTVSDGSNLSLNGRYTGRGANAGAAVGLNLTGLVRSTALNPGSLSLTGAASAVAASSTNEVGLSVSQLTGWGPTTLLAQNPAGSPSAALSVSGQVNVGSHQLQVLANGGQVTQGAGSTWAAGQVTVDNTGAGRSSLFADTSGSANTADGQSFGGSIAGDGSISIGTARSSGIAVNLNGAIVSSGGVNIAGGTNAASALANGVYSSGTILANGGSVHMQGISSVGGGVSLQGSVTARDNVNLSGSSTSVSSQAQGVVIQSAVKANTGDITVTGTTNSAVQRAVAITTNGAVNGSLEVAASHRNLSIHADTLFINTAASVNAGATGTVTIQTTSGNALDVGSADTISASAGSRVLGLDQGELNRITAGQLVLGSSAGGPVKVASTVTTADAAGDMTLRTGSSIDVANNLTVGSSGGKNLSLETYGASGGITSVGVIRADQLKLLGTDSSAVTLVAAAHQVNTLAAQVGSLDFRNGQALAVGTAAGLDGIAARDGVNVRTTTGNLSLNKPISNSQSGPVVLGAGVATAAGTSSGGDVTTSPGASVTNGQRAVRLYTGSTAGTGNLAHVSASLDSLFFTGTSHALNTAFHQAEGDSLAGGAQVQVLFRQAAAPTVTGSLTGVALEREYNGRSVQTNSDLAAFKAALKAQSANTGVFSSAIGANDFAIAKADVIDQLAFDAPTQGIRNVLRGASQAVHPHALGLDTSGLGALGFAFAAQGEPSNTLKITPKAASISGVATNVTYNGQTQSQTAPVLSGFIQADLDGGTVGATGLASGRNAGTYTSQLAAIGSDIGNYNVTVTNADLVVAQKAASISGVTTNVTYNGQTQSQTAPVLSGFIQADLDGGTVGATGLATGRNAGTYTSQLAAIGSDIGNYSVTVTNADLVVAQKAASISGVTTNVTYNGQTQTQLTPLLSGFIQADLDNGTVGATGLATGRNAGSYTSNLAATGSDVGNYNVTVTNADLVVAPKAASISGVATNVTYNGQTQTQTAAVLSGFIQADLDGGTVGAKGLATGRNAGSYTSQLAAIGSDIGNYNVTVTNADLVVAPKAASISGVATNVTYNGQTQSQTAPVLSGFVQADLDGGTVGATGLATGRNAGSYTSNLAATGSDVGNYNVTVTNADLVVAPKAASISGVATNVTYNGQTQSQTAAVLSGFIQADLDGGTVGATGLATGRNAGSYTSNLAATGSDVGNYNVTVTNADLVVAPKAASISGVATTVTYNGQTQSQATAVLSGFLQADLDNGTVAATGLATGRNAGSYTSNLAATGRDAGNYSVTVSNADLLIARKNLSVVGSTVVDKPFDGQVSAAISRLGTLQGLVEGESLKLSALAQFADAQPGIAKPVTVSYSLADGANGSALNYLLSPNAHTVSATILPLPAKSSPSTLPAASTSTGTRVCVAGVGTGGAAAGRTRDGDAKSMACNAQP